MSWLDRELISQLVIIFAVAIGAWMMFVQPQADELAELDEVLRETAPVVDDAQVDDLDALGEQVADARGEIRLIAERNEAARDSSRIYGAVSQVAEQHGVTLLRLNPGAQRGRAGEKADGEQPKAHATHFEGAVLGRYEEVAAFLGSMNESRGFVRPVSLTLMPSQEGADQLVEAQFAFEMIRFTLPESLQALAEASS